MDDVAVQSVDNVAFGPDQHVRPTILDPRPGEHAQRWGLALTGGRAVRFFLLVHLIAFAVLTSFATAIGLLVDQGFEHGALGSWDNSANLWFTVYGSNSRNLETTCVRFAADTLTVTGIAVVVTLILLFRRCGRTAFILVTSMAIELSEFITANTIDLRPRPSMRHLEGTPTTFSFPSGDATPPIALHGRLALRVSAPATQRGIRDAVGLSAALIATAPGVSRICRGEHYVSDVRAGAIAGTGAPRSMVVMTSVVTAQTGADPPPGPSSKRSDTAPSNRVTA